MDDLVLEEGTLVDHRYAVETQIGRGGMAAVYRVRHVHLQTQHALKVLTISHGSVQARLMQEGMAQAALNHPNIVRVTDVVHLDSGVGLVMEYVRGPSLEELLPERELTLEQMDAVALGILDGVAAAHAMRLIHRDLKPANVMMALQPGALVPKVADFGLVKMVAGDGDEAFSKTRSGMTMGTPAYMAPEQIRDAKKVDARADIWSLGAILYELVSGVRAFDAADIVDLFVKVSTGNRTPIRELCPDLPQRMVDAIEGALTVDAADRFADVSALRGAWLSGAVLPTESPWDPDTLTLAAALGAGGDSTEDYLERSFRSELSLRGSSRRTPRPQPRQTGATFVPEGLDDPGPAPTAVLAGADPTLVPPGQDPTVAPLPPSAVATAMHPPGSLASGTFIVDSAEPSPAQSLEGPVPSDTAPAAAHRQRTKALVAGLVSAAALAAVLAGVGATVALRSLAQTNPSTSATTAPPPTPNAAPAPAPAPAPETAPAPPVATPQDAPEPPAPTEPSPAPSVLPPEGDPNNATASVPPKPVPAPAPEPDPDPSDAVASLDPDLEAPDAAPSVGTVSFESDVSAYLVDSTGRRVRDPGATAPGTYELIAYFTPGEASPQGVVEVQSGRSYTVTCKKFQLKCGVR